mmetsp:Transcript_15947/g.20242  ORF Transcript_15947/g.20242 Transcript_15947/m.20242 type:complete len:276 (+) Transcript_15947:60-887(+)|eukprot:CAMPEP_0203662656 /NCGR_PEP_ID=MMETSP0090-20130426/548_1 /ASSEMBLY_ACC=CAM_ASM_001088 /TAXON_ID=426623 /ORGANISM="Chaetoceros affinis, Strain CCMP159" /LENGTH=275 /DNA_ID=CAMNT_0050525479 /DNA_START=14 /DNA_END=841 /DNA_ORIENTATION=+
MKTASTILAALITSAAAAPAIVWKSGESSAQIHSSELTGIRSLVEESNSDSSLASVVFVIERDEHGSDGLTVLSTTGALPEVAAKYSDASSIHHSVRGIETVEKALKDLGHPTASTLEEYQDEINEVKAAAAAVNHDGSQKVSGNMLVVTVPNDARPADIDATVKSAIEDPKVGSVVLTSVRGISEVKFERDLKAKEEYFDAQQKFNRRRLEDANGDDNYSNEVLYFVNFTPNIFSGVMFFFFFSAVTFVGISCMGMIAGQEVYVTKYPTIGREA